MNVQELPASNLIEVDAEYRALLDEVEYHCSLCEAVHEDVTVLNSKIESVYKSVVEKTKTNRNHLATIKNWLAAYYVASDIRQAVCMKKEVHKICGIDTSTIDEIYGAIEERLGFLLGFEIKANCT
jgi:hypothetical protein